MSGENILFDGLDRFNLCIGDVFAVESPQGIRRKCSLQLSSPRKPCKRWEMKYGSSTGVSVRHYVLTNTCGGWFFRVLRPGFVEEGDRIILVERPNPQWSLERIGRKLYGCAGRHIDTWTSWTGSCEELQELAGLKDLAMREWREPILHLHAAAAEP